MTKIKVKPSDVYWGGHADINSTVIELNSGITLTLTKDQLMQLLGKLAPKLKADMQTMIEADERIEKRRIAVRDLINGIRTLFYEDFAGMYLLRDSKEIDADQLEKLLEQHSVLLGFSV